MERSIIGFHLDSVGDYVAELSCGHGQHVRHRPPFEERSWVLDDASRSEHLNTSLDCPLCGRAELPGRAVVVRTSPLFDEQSMPRGLRQAHRLAAGSWGRLVVEEGRLAYRAEYDPPFETVVAAGASQVIAPEIEHRVEPLGTVRFRIEFLSCPPGDGGPASAAAESEAATVSSDEGAVAEGGDPACWAHLVCPECGVVLSSGGHRPGCPSAG